MTSLTKIRQQQPYKWYQTMRETSPVHYNEKEDCWEIFTYDEVKRVISDYSHFSSDHKYLSADKQEKMIRHINKDSLLKMQSA
nr:hypothetical protein P5660_12760 [Bacillus velezensis]